MKKENYKRIQWLDMAKGYGILCVIIAHLDIPYFDKWIYTFHMPLFFFLSGYVFNEKLPFKDFMVKKIKNLLIPYFCLGMGIILFCVFYGQIHIGMTTDFKTLFNLLIMQKRLWTLWFLACLFLLNILYYLILKLVKNIKVVSLIVLVLSIVGLRYYQLGGLPLYWNADVCLTAMLFFHVGYIVKKKELLDKYIFSKNHLIQTIIFLIINVVTGYFGYKISGQTLEMFQNMYGCIPLTYISAFSGILFVINLSKSFVIRPIRYIGENSIIYFAWHQTIMMTLISDFYYKIGIFQNVPLPFFENLLMVSVTVIIICVVLTIVNIAIKKSFLKFIIGK